MARLLLETGHMARGTTQIVRLCTPLFGYCHILCVYAAFTGDAYWETLFGSPAQKRWDEASARRFTPYPALCGASCCSVFVTALYEIARIVARGQKGCQASEQSIIHNSSFIIVLFLSFGFEIKMHLFQSDRAARQICPPEHGERTLLSGQDYVRIDRREAGRWRNAGRSSGI